MNLKNRSFITLKDFSAQEITYLLDLSAQLKAKKKAGIKGNLLEGKNIALIFEKSSTRTRCAFAVACADEGAHSEYLGAGEIQLGKKESIEDTARVLGRMFDGIEFRGFAHAHAEALEKYSGVPVWNGLTDEYHPTQVLADLLTVREHLGTIAGKKLVYIGDGRNNVANSLLVGCSKMGMDISIVAPTSLQPDQAIVAICRDYAKSAGSSIVISEEISAVEHADVLYTDVWCSMGEEAKAAERVTLLKDYQINESLIQRVNNPALMVLHCLPAVKGNEITEDVFEAHANEIFDEAENRLHTIKAVMVATLG